MHCAALNALFAVIAVCVPCLGYDAVSSTACNQSCCVSVGCSERTARLRLLLQLEVGRGVDQGHGLAQSSAKPATCA
jgi:hypothetical protein